MATETRVVLCSALTHITHGQDGVTVLDLCPAEAPCPLHPDGVAEHVNETTLPPSGQVFGDPIDVLRMFTFRDIGERPAPPPENPWGSAWPGM